MSNVFGLSVTSASSSFAYKGKQTKAQQVAKEINVSYVLEGRVEKSGDRIRALQRAKSLTKRLHPTFYAALVDADLLSGKLDEAGAGYLVLLETSQVAYDQSHAHLGLALIYADQDREADARSEVAKAVDKYPEQSIRFQTANLSLKDGAILDRWLAVWRQSGTAGVMA